MVSLGALVAILAIIALLVAILILVLARGQKSLREALDGRLSQLLSVTEKLAMAQGIATGRREAAEERFCEVTKGKGSNAVG